MSSLSSLLQIQLTKTDANLLVGALESASWRDQILIWESCFRNFPGPTGSLFHYVGTGKITGPYVKRDYCKENGMGLLSDWTHG